MTYVVVFTAGAVVLIVVSALLLLRQWSTRPRLFWEDDEEGNE